VRGKGRGKGAGEGRDPLLLGYTPENES